MCKSQLPDERQYVYEAKHMQIYRPQDCDAMDIGDRNFDPSINIKEIKEESIEFGRQYIEDVKLKLFETESMYGG